MKFSFIIPVYNAEKYLNQCIDSILLQTYKNIEILLVDDESKDSSPKICDNYAKKDDRIISLHKKNGGTSDSRNVGIKNASGDYIIFLDNDDYWNDINALQKIANHLGETNADVLLFDTITYWQNRQKFIYPENKCKRSNVAFQNNKTALLELIKNGKLYCTVWTKVVKTKLIKENNIFFIKNMRNEDTEWTANLIIHAQSFDWYDGNPFHVYRKGSGNAQTDIRVTPKEIQDLKEILEKYITFCHNNKNYEEILYNYLAYPFAVFMAQSKCVKNIKTNNDFKHMSKYAKNILSFDLDPSVKKVNLLYKITGYNITSQILKLYLLFKYRNQK